MFKYTCRLAGVRFRPSYVRLRVEALKEGDELRLEREPTNTNDPNAIRVYAVTDDANATWLGYVPREIAAIISPLLDEANPPATVVVDAPVQYGEPPLLLITIGEAL